MEIMDNNEDRCPVCKRKYSIKEYELATYVICPNCRIEGIRPHTKSVKTIEETDRELS
jgi:ssDNA-binding Zn-finger/Zn-ribbon topoisomerase 1